MASTEEVAKRLHESRPPATDAFTYLTIIEKSLSPEILPVLQDILDDAELTNDIGWDLVDMLISVPGSAECLERIARLGNPREVILKTLEVMDKTAASATGDQKKADGEVIFDEKFVALVGMLKILHARLRVKAPSRFLHTTLDTVLRAYDPTSSAQTAAIIDLIRSLSGKKRPALPTRQSSTTLDTPFQATNPAQSAPDPEADDQAQPGPMEPALMSRLLQSFITCIIEAYVNSNSLEWAARLLEHSVPERIVLRRGTMLQAYNEIAELQAMDALVGQLVSVAGDLGVSDISADEVREICTGPISRDPLSMDDADPEHPEVIPLSSGGFACLAAYKMFATDVFEAHHTNFNISVFPDLHTLFKNLAEGDAQSEIMGNPGTFEALVVMAIWLDTHGGTLPEKRERAEEDVNIMSYHHLLTLVSIFHPNLRVRNASTFMAGSVLHADPNENDRLAILEDLMENCAFAALQACAVTWLKEEIIAAKKAEDGKSHFASPECFDKLQYTVFPDLTHLESADVAALWEFWTNGSPFHLQVANFALFLFTGDGFQSVVPSGMGTAIEHRYAAPLLKAASRLIGGVDKGEIGEEGADEAKVQLSILIDTLKTVSLH
ncbi:uncharacterized protein J7T54_005766 [Emericellopsis cladophorae]|uniref:DUF1760-domain-containing protein n=1 Tax=Emericellopsis cladophorae TaxID=2686198 RepID=A0A9Q0BCG9_9HYPO|nr:uncharacterized protein J7T54_005766 [Emericellopsis cladophorae]KAI6779736.1 hypothetical protein J7T54_005766 [Emericellopsis cladophorae]